MKEGRLEAASESAAIQALTGMGLQPFRVKIEGGGAGARGSGQFRFFALNKATRSGRRRKVWVLTRELAALLHAGLPLPNALQALAREQQDPELKNLLDDCLDQVSSGKGLAQALSAHPEWFDPMYVRLVRAGELVGALDEVLLRLSQDMQRAEQLKGRVRSAMAYPVFLMLAGVAVVSFLMMRVVPTILVILDDLSQNIPVPTKVLMAMTRVFRVSFWPFVILLLVFLLGSRLWVSRVENRKKWDRFRLRIPLLGPMLRSASTTRFARTLSSLLRAGIPLLSGLSVARGTVNNLFIEETIADAEKDVERGRPLAEALEQSGAFPPSFIYLVRAGEISGELPQLLDEAADIFEEQLERKSERFVSLLEPLLITVLGGLVLLIVMAILLPIFEMNQAAGP
jgi:general secretion pathway protein F